MTLPPNDLPPLAINAYQELTPEEQAAFSAHFTAHKRNMALMLLLAIFFPIQLFLLGKVGLGILFWLTGWGLLVWWVIEWFLTPGRVRDYNSRLATDTLNLIKAGKGPSLMIDEVVEEEE